MASTLLSSVTYPFNAIKQQLDYFPVLKKRVVACAKLTTAMLGCCGWLFTGPSWKSPPQTFDILVSRFDCLSHFPCAQICPYSSRSSTSHYSPAYISVHHFPKTCNISINQSTDKRTHGFVTWCLKWRFININLQTMLKAHMLITVVIQKSQGTKTN